VHDRARDAIGCQTRLQSVAGGLPGFFAYRCESEKRLFQQPQPIPLIDLRFGSKVKDGYSRKFLAIHRNCWPGR
jgi:hypothetical protein